MFVDPEDNTITLEEDGKEPSYRGSLVIVPTPIGNLGDISLRQYEALTTCDIIACEDTRKTGKMLQLLQDKRIREKFKTEFGVSVEDFMEKGDTDFGENVNELKKGKDDQQHEHSTKEQIQWEVHGARDDEAIGEDLEDTKFYLSEEEFNDQRTLNRLQQANQDIDTIQSDPREIDESRGTDMRAHVQEILESLELEIEKNKFGDLERDVIKERDNALALSMTSEDKEFVEMVDQEYYKRVKTSGEYYRRKKLILQSLEKLQKKVEKQAIHYDDYAKLRFIMIEKARQKKSILKNFIKLENFEQTNSSRNRFFEAGEGAGDDSFGGQFNQSHSQDDFEELYGIENEFTRELKEKIDHSKSTKGRGLLLSFYEFNQERRIPRLIRAMKSGLRVALVSDAGTPCISDPGFKFIGEAKEQGIVVEALPGPCAVTTALSASGFPADKFQFFGYLSKTQGEREDTLLEIQRSGRTTALYESPHRLMRTLYSIEEIFGPAHPVYVGFELTKRHEQHYRDGVQRVRSQLEESIEGSRLKGEVTLVISVYREDEEMKQILQGQKFNPNKDAIMKVNILKVAQRLNDQVEMSEGEFRNLLKALFPDVPSYHASAMARIVRAGGQKSRLREIAGRLGGAI